MKNNLRPQQFKEFIGQDKVKRTIKIMINSAKKQNKTIDHILFYGPPGVGKTTLASIISKEMSADIHYAQGPMLDKKSDLLALVGSIKKGDVVFIDEIHGINKSIEEMLYSVIEDGVIDVAIGPEGNTKIVRIKLPFFTLVAATTKLHKISEPLKTRFGLILKLNNYSILDISKIISRSSQIMKLKISEKAIKLIASYSQTNPRIANNFLKRCHDFMHSMNKLEITEKVVKKTFSYLGVHQLGLNDSHINYLQVLLNKLRSRWSSIETIASLLSEEKNSLEKIIEPKLIELGLIEKSSKGRKITYKGEEYLTLNKLDNV